jgi:hypothetical protein
LNEKDAPKIKTWPDLKEAWISYRDKIDEIKDGLEFLVPIELLVPSDIENEQIVLEFSASLLDICAARNNNVQLSVETKANKKGFYDEIKKLLPSNISENIEWKTNDGGKIKVRDLVSLSWIPLNKLNSLDLLPIDISISPQNIYRNKGECSKLFDQLMNHEDVTKSADGRYDHTLHDSSVQSAIKILSELPELYDMIYIEFPEAYNIATQGRFGRNPIVKIYDQTRVAEAGEKYMRTQPYSKFTNKPLKYRYPDGLIMPLVYGLSALITVQNTQLVWIVNPKDFLNKWLMEIAKSYKFVLDMSLFDPQKVGKNETSYELAVNFFENSLLKHKAEKK